MSKLGLEPSGARAVPDFPPALLVWICSFQLVPSNCMTNSIEPSKDMSTSPVSLRRLGTGSYMLHPDSVLVRKLVRSACFFVWGKVSCGPGRYPTCYTARAGTGLLISCLCLPNAGVTAVSAILRSLGNLELSFSLEPWAASILMTEKPEQKKYKNDNF